MEIRQRRIHIAGSAVHDCDLDKLKYAHSLVALLTKTFLSSGATLCAQVGKEPMHEEDEDTSIIFDWTIIQSVYDYAEDAFSIMDNTSLPILTTVITEKTEAHIPEKRKLIWRTLIQKSYIHLLSHPKQWTAGAVRRDRIATVGDILILLSGGEGVEHLAQLYIGQKKPVIALDLNLGASTETGIGRAVAINQTIASNPQRYLSPKNPETIGSLWENISTRDGSRPEEEIVRGVFSLLEALEPPTAFCVRLLNSSSPNFLDVENFFTKVVNPAISEMDYKLVVSPQSPYESRWLNEQIFSGIHESELVIVDITDERPNCLIELGYALGRNRRVLVCAKQGTTLPFDVDKIECFFWSLSADLDKTEHDFREFVKRNLEQAPLVPTITLF